MLENTSHTPFDLSFSSMITIPFEYKDTRVVLEATKPTPHDLETLPLLVITSGMEWAPYQDVSGDHNGTRWYPLENDNPNVVNRRAQL